MTKFDGFEVEVVDPVADYLACLKEVFDFAMLKAFVSRSDFSMIFDAMNAVTGEHTGRQLLARAVSGHTGRVGEEELG